MNEKYKKGNYELEITDAGITHKTISINNTVFFPYGSMDLIEYGIGGLRIESGTIFRSYSPSKDEKKKLKNMISTLVRLNQSAERTKPIIDFGEKEENGIEPNVTYGKQSEMTKKQSFWGYGIIIAIVMVIVIISTVLSSRDTGTKWSDLSEEEKQNAKWDYELMQEIEENK